MKLRTKKKYFAVGLLLLVMCFCLFGWAFTSGVFTRRVFAVESANGAEGTIEAGAVVFSDDTAYTFNKPPKNLVGVKYLKSPKAGDTYTAVSDGWVYILTTRCDESGITTVSQREALLNDGFEEVNFSFAPDFMTGHNNTGNACSYAPLQLYKKYFKNGASFTLEWFSVVMFSEKAIDFETPSVASNAGDSVKTAAVGETIWSDSTEVFADTLPEAFRGLKFMQSVKTGGKSEAVRSGYVYVLATNTALTGFTKIDCEPVTLYEGSAGFNVFYKLVNPGDATATGGSMVQFFSSEILALNDSMKIVERDELAVLKVSDPISVMTFENGAKFYLDRLFKLSDVPAALNGLLYTNNYIDGNQTGKATSVEVVKSGRLYALGNSAGVAALTDLGFVKTGELALRRVYPTIEGIFLMHKDVTAGETYTTNVKWSTFIFSNVPAAGDNLAKAEGTHASGIEMRRVKIEDKARIYDNRHFFVKDDLPSWFYGKTILQPKYDEGGSFTVTEAGTVYMLVNQGVAAPAGFEKVNYPVFKLSYSLVMQQTQLYAKECAVGETVSYATTCVPVLAPLSEEEYSVENAMTAPAIINLASDANADLRAEFDVQDRNFQGCASIAVTAGGRYFYGLFTGGQQEPQPENYGIVLMGDENGVMWDPLFVIRHTAAAPDRVRVEDVQLWMQPGTNNLWIFWTNSGCVEEWNDTWNNFDHSLGVWAAVIQNPDADDPADLQWTEPRRISDGLMRNKPTVLSNGDILVCAYDAMNNSWANVYVMESAGINDWISSGTKEEWKLKGSVYAPQNSVFDEHQIVELSDGTLWMLMRAPKGITQSYSYDGGSHWTEAELVPGLKGGDSRFYLAKLPESLVKANGLKGDILFVNHMPPSGVSRTYLSAMILNESGEIVHGPLLLDERACSYPDVEILPDGTILTAYDRGRSADMELLLARYTVQDIVQGNFVSAGSAKKIILSKSYKKSPMSVAEEVFVLMGSDAVIGASLPARTLLSLSRMENGEVVETVSDEYYSFENEKIVLVNEYLKKFADGKFDFRVTAERYDGSYETQDFTLTRGSASTESTDFEMVESERGGLYFATAGTESEVFSFTEDDGRDVLKIQNPSASWSHDSVLLNGNYFGNVEVETVFRRDASVSSKNGFGVIVMRKTAPDNTHEQAGGGIGFAFLKEGVLVIYDTETSNYLVNQALPKGLYKDNEYNTVRIIAEGNRFLIYLNGQYVMTYTHTAGLLAEVGYVGVASSNGVIYVDSIKVRQFDEKTLKISDVSRFYDFKDAAQLEDFESWYSEDNNVRTMDAQVIGRWQLDANGIHRNAAVSGGTNQNITSLYLKDVFLTNFDMSVDFKRNTTNVNWLTLVGRVRYKGITAENIYSGGGSFMTFLQREGYPTFRSAVSSGGYITGTTITNYVDTAWHNLRVVCVGMQYNVYVDYQLVLTYEGNNHDALGGYLGMTSKNNTGAYRNFSVTALDVNGNPIAMDTESNRKVKVATIGDSITYGAGAASNTMALDPKLTYPSQLAEMFGSEVDLRNFGIAGRRLLDGADCFANEPEYQASLDYAPDIVFIMLGTNDIKSIYWTGSDVGERYKQAYAEMIQAYRTANPNVEIFVMTSPYLYLELEAMSGTVLAQELIPLQHEVAEENGCYLIDVFTATTGKPELFPDNIHPNAEGYALIAELVYEAAIAELNAQIAPADEAEFDLLIDETGMAGVTVTLGERVLDGAKVEFVSENEDVVTVDEAGRFLAVGMGETNLRASIGSKSFTFAVRVSKHTPEFNVYVPELDYVFGDKMPSIFDDSALGSIRFADGQTLTAGDLQYEWIFTPYNKDYYNTVTGYVTIHVEKAQPFYTTPVLQKTVEEVTGLKLSDFDLPDGFTWKNADESVTGSGYYTAIYSKDASGNYLDVEAQVYIDLEVTKVPDTQIDECSGAVLSTGLYPSVFAGLLLLFASAMVVKRKD